MALIDPADLAAFGVPDDEKTTAMIADAIAQAVILAPCLAVAPDELDPAVAAAAKAILRGALVRWHEAGSGAKVTTQQTASIFSESQTIDTTQKRRGAFWPSEITDLQRLCKTTKRRPFTITMGEPAAPHLPWCDVMFGGLSCSCGVAIAGRPIYEGGDW